MTEPALSLPPLRQAFETYVATVMRVCNLPRLEAECAAFDIVLVEHLNATHLVQSEESAASISPSVGAASTARWPVGHLISLGRRWEHVGEDSLRPASVRMILVSRDAARRSPILRVTAHRE